MWLISKLLKIPNENRDVISDKIRPVNLRSSDCVMAAKEFSLNIKNAIKTFKDIDDLFNNPIVEYNSEKHIRVTLCDPEIRIDGRLICVVFLNETCKPIFAYLKDSANPDNQ